MKKLDEIALNIELVLISIIEGVALVSLVENSVEVLKSPEWFIFLPFIVAGLLILLVFWAQAILHAVSFIRWPLRMEHMLLYFVAAFLQGVAYSNLTNLTGWFVWWTIFSLLAIVIYIVDLYIIRSMKTSFEMAGGPAFITSVEHRHLYELKYLVPIALFFNLFGLFIALHVPSIYELPLLYMGLGTLQALFSLGALYDCIKNFRERSKMLPPLFGI